jgi:simple sugar transport system substrate-binding protein
MKKIFTAAGLLVLGTAVLFAGGTKENPVAKPSSGDITIVVMPKLVGIPYFNASETGAKQAGRDLGVNVIYTGPTTADAADQVKMIEDLMTKGVNAICVAPNNAQALTPILMRAKKAGVTILDWDTPADPAVVDFSIHQIDDKVFGEHLFDLLVKYMGNSGNYAILTGGLSAANLNSWLDNGLAYAKNRYPDLHLVTDRVPTDEKQQLAYQRTLDLIKAYPDLKGIVGVSTPSPIGAAQAVQEKGMQNKIAVVGSALPTDSGPYLEDGSLDASTLWDPAKLGYLTVYIANSILHGKKPVDGMDIPNVGKITVRPDGKTIIMGPPADFLKDNYKNYKF